MEVTSVTSKNDAVVVAAEGHIDATNAPGFEEAVRAGIAGHSERNIVFDLADVSYVSSAGLRVFMRIAKEMDSLSMVNVPSEVYDVFEMTGFTEIFSISKALRRISVEGCTVIGRGAKGAVYRLDPETIVKVVFAAGEEALSDIARERELARAAFVAGIPTAISYDVVRVGESYGAVYELLDAKTMSELVAAGEMSPEQAGKELGLLMAQMHETPARPSLMPSARDAQLDELTALDGALDAELYKKIFDAVAALPDDDYLIHGDFHAGNVMVQNGEALLIDMDTLSRGNSVLELGPVYNAYVGFGELDQSIFENFQGFSYESGQEIWESILARYTAERSLDSMRVRELGELMGRIRQLRRVVAHGDAETDHGRAVIARCTPRVAELLSAYPSLAL